MTHETWPRALEPLAPAPPGPGIYVAAGPALLPAWFLSALCPALSREGRLFWIDAGNSFNAYGLGYAARALGRNPRSLLARVSLARPFNLFQLETMVREKLPERWRGEPVVLSDPFPLFYDEDVPVPEARRVFRSLLGGMAALPAVWMVLDVERAPPKGRAGWPAELHRRARSVAELKAQGARWLLEGAGG